MPDIDPFEEYNLDPENDLPINVEELDVEWLTQDTVFRKYGNALADANKRVKQAQEEIKTIRSDLVLEANEDPSCMGKGVKPTGPNIEAYYRTDDNYKKAKKNLFQIEWERDVLDVAKSSAYGRGFALPELSKLALMGWFASPSQPKELKELIRLAEKKNSSLGDAKIRAALDKKRMRRTT